MIRMTIGIPTSNGCTHYFANCSFLNLRLVSLIQSLSVSGMRNSVQPRSNSMVLLWAGVPDISRCEIPHGEFRISYSRL